MIPAFLFQSCLEWDSEVLLWSVEVPKGFTSFNIGKLKFTNQNADMLLLKINAYLIK